MIIEDEKTESIDNTFFVVDAFEFFFNLESKNFKYFLQKERKKISS